MIRFREGMRVRCTSVIADVPRGTTGTVGTVATGRGKSIYPDPSRMMVFVDWDNGTSIGVFRWEVERG
jgi:hypothetical protein